MASHIGTFIVNPKTKKEEPAPEGFNPRKPSYSKKTTATGVTAESEDK